MIDKWSGPANERIAHDLNAYDVPPVDSPAP
jgi:hypothetical protein